MWEKFDSGWFNVDSHDPQLQIFCEVYNLKSLMKQPICYKNPDK